MINFLIGIAVSLGLYYGLGQFLDTWIVVLISLLAGGVAYYFLARRTNKQLELRMVDVRNALEGQDPNGALEVLEEARSLGRWQFLINTMIDGQVGAIHYAHKQDHEAALPYLEKAVVKNWHARAMLAGIHFKRRKFDDMKQVFEDTVKFNKKESMLWAAYAFCQSKRGMREEALAIIERGRVEMPDDERLKQLLIALQNRKRMNMKAYEPDWYALMLERPPGYGLQNRPMPKVPGAQMKMKRMRRG